MEATVDPLSPGSRLDADHPENGVLIPCRFTRLHKEGLATVSLGVVQLHDMAGLHRLAQPVFDIFERSRPEFGGQQSQSALIN
jgi:hypothetical protein